jgi:hypothetical protein
MRGPDVSRLLTAIGLEKVRIASEVNFKARDMLLLQIGDVVDEVSSMEKCRACLTATHATLRRHQIRAHSRCLCIPSLAQEEEDIAALRWA